MGAHDTRPGRTCIVPRSGCGVTKAIGVEVVNIDTNYPIPSLSSVCRKTAMVLSPIAGRLPAKPGDAGCRPTPMQDTLEQQLAERYPQWFRGRRAVVARPLLRGLAHGRGWSHVYEFLASHAHLSGFALVEAAMEFLEPALHRGPGGAPPHPVVRDAC